MNAYYFREDKTAVLGAIKAQLPFSEHNKKLRELKPARDAHSCHITNIEPLLSDLLPAIVVMHNNDGCVALGKQYKN